MRFPATAWTDQQNVMLVVGQHAAGESVDDSVQQTLALNEDSLQQFAIRVAGGVRGDDRPTVHVEIPWAETHHCRIKGKRNA